tara:strand:+ start:21 stop:812 length:792 start_codon:yes stop_codon:yes gene_type:complete
MKIARYKIGSQVAYGIVDLDKDSVTDIRGTPFEPYEKTSNVHKLSDVKLLAPATPINLFTTGVNSRSHAESVQNAPQYSPTFMTRPTPTVSIRNIASIVGHEDKIIRPADAESFRTEVEMVVVVGKKMKKVTGPDVYNYILGYTVGNDLTIKEAEYAREGWRAKNCDTMHPIGPWIETELDSPRDVMRRSWVNGELTQEEACTNDRFGVPEVVGRIAWYITLYPGDMIFMGTCGEPPDGQVGDTVEVGIEGIGVLRNYIIADE